MLIDTEILRSQLKILEQHERKQNHPPYELALYKTYESNIWLVEQIAQSVGADIKLKEEAV